MNKFISILIICLFIIIINISHELLWPPHMYDSNFKNSFFSKPLIENYESLSNCYYYGYPREFCLQVPIESKIMPLKEEKLPSLLSF